MTKDGTVGGRLEYTIKLNNVKCDKESPGKNNSEFEDTEEYKWNEESQRSVDVEESEPVFH